MATGNLYTLYKRDTRHLVYWLIRASNNVIRSLKDAPVGLELNTDGKTTVAGILAMARLVSEHMKRSDIPDVIFYLFQAVIRARNITYKAFSKLESGAIEPDADIQKSNAAHKHFINILSESLEALSGPDGSAKHKDTPDSARKPAQADLDELVRFANKFDALSTDDGDDPQHDSGTDPSPEDPGNKAPKGQRKKPKSRKGNKGKGRKGKSQKRQRGSHAASEQVSLESCGIIEEGDGENFAYCMAILDLAHEWIEIRGYSQGTWSAAAYDGLHSIVAAAVSNAGIAMIQRSELALAVDFPGSDNFQTIINNLSRGGPEPYVSKASLIDPDDTDNPVAFHIDVKEHVMYYTYNDLTDFLHDFQKTRSGQPTKKMLAQLQNWDPGFNLRQASQTERIKWRRAYTINWLYDLVNVYSSPVVQGKAERGERPAYEEMDWSIHGPCGQQRRLFGLNEFAATITAFAMQKPGTEICHKIMPHHVLQLQCIIDAFTVSRGWAHSTFVDLCRGPAEPFRPRRDVDRFLDRQNPKLGLDNNSRPTQMGWLRSADAMNSMFLREDGTMEGGHNTCHAQFIKLHSCVRDNFTDWLGELKYVYGRASAPPSRFAQSHANGLWEFSPFLCGAGLMEALELSYSLGLRLWHERYEPIAIIHLYNMLLKRGYINKPIDLYDYVAKLLAPALFVDGNIPDSEFAQAFLARMHETGARRTPLQRYSARKSAANVAINAHSILDTLGNRYSEAIPALSMLRRANWNPDRIADHELRFGSELFSYRLARSGEVLDPLSGEQRLEDSSLVLKAKKHGFEEKKLLEVSRSQRGQNSRPADDLLKLKQHLCKKYDLTVPSRLSDRLNSGNSGAPYADLGPTELLSLLRLDIAQEIQGSRPWLAVNYEWLYLDMLMLAMEVYKCLGKELRCPVYDQVHDRDRPYGERRRTSLMQLALAGNNDQCLRKLAEVYESHICGSIQNYTYWDLTETIKGVDSNLECSVM